jgi:hypothetical protein
MPGDLGYGTVPRGPVPVRSGLPRRTKLYAVSVVSLLLVGCIVLTAWHQAYSDEGSVDYTELMARGDELDRKYMAAEAQGQAGRNLIKKMQQIWFIGSRARVSNMVDLSKDATSLAIELMTAEVGDPSCLFFSSLGVQNAFTSKH